MTPPPAHPKIYHITHVENLRDIVADGGLVSDAEMIAWGGPAAAIGMLKELRTALISAAVTGKIDVREEKEERSEIQEIRA